MEENNTPNTHQINEELPKGLSIAGMVIGIVNVLGGWYCCCGIGPLVGAVISIVALKKCNAGEMDGKGMALAGVITNVIVLLFSIVYMVFMGGYIALIAMIESGGF